jgi:hypothetical protein
MFISDFPLKNTDRRTGDVPRWRKGVSCGVDWTVVGIEECNFWEPQTVLQLHTD